MEGYHRSVLLKKAVDALIPTRPGQDGLAAAGGRSWFLDVTLGDGGHSLEILRRGGRVLGIDVDPEAIRRAKERLDRLGFLGKAILVQGNFRDIDNLLKQTELRGQKFAGAIFDLGVSSLQLETPQRGFSFAKQGELDMRMDPSLAVKALDLVNNLSRKELYELFHNLGEEKYSKRLADTLVRARAISPIRTTGGLAELVTGVVRGGRGVRGRKDFRVHPATRVFQALRIAVNDELNALEEGLEKLKDFIKKDGHLVVISFHSLEDRIVKNAFKRWQYAGLGEILTKKPIVPSEMEVTDNPRARSAKMRVFKKK